MKKTGLLVVLAFLSGSIMAQSQDFGFLKGVKEFSVEMDYSQTRFDKKVSEDFFMIANNRNPNFETTYKKEMLLKFIVSINSYLPDGCRVKENSQNAEYKIIVRVMSLNGDKDTNADILITRTDSSEILAQFAVYGEAGKYGSFANLSGDAMVKVGEKAGKFLSKKVK
jgi:hypothetical protein